MPVPRNLINQTLTNQDGDWTSDSVDVSVVTTANVDATVSAIGGGTTYVLSVERQGNDGAWYSIYSFAGFVAAGAKSRSFGPGMETGVDLGHHARLKFARTAGAGTVTATISMFGK